MKTIVKSTWEIFKASKKCKALIVFLLSFTLILSISIGMSSRSITTEFFVITSILSLIFAFIIAGMIHDFLL